jgi:hypothetical protein
MDCTIPGGRHGAAVWIALSVFPTFTLLAFRRKQNVVLEMAAMCALAGTLVAGVSMFVGQGFHWQTIGKWAVVGTLIGAAIEIVSRLRPKTP